MAVFNPKEAPKPDTSNIGVPANDYLIVIKGFKRKQGQKSGADYIRCGFEVIDGVCKGQKFWDAVSLDLNNAGTVARLSLLFEATEAGAVELEDDKALREAICNKPFKARVSRSKQGQYVNNGIERYLNSKVTETERDTMKAWREDWEAQREINGGGGGGGASDNGLPEDGDAPARDDDDFMREAHGGKGGRRGGPGDDIPF